MGRPKNKAELVDACDENFEKLMTFIDNLPKEKQHAEFPQNYMNRRISDVLCHLHHWHLMLFNWYNIGMAGEKPDMPAKGYTWKDTPALNQSIWKEYRNTNLEKARELFNDSHNKILDLIKSHSNDELFEKKRYKWTGTTSMGAYMISASSSHYDWAYKLIKKCCK